MSVPRKFRIAYAFTTAILLLIAIYLYVPSGITGNIVYEDKIALVNFSAPKGTVASGFFGANTHGIWGSPNTRIDANGDGVPETFSNHTWHRDALLISNITYIRGDSNLETTVQAEGGMIEGNLSSANVQAQREMTRWAYENNKTILWILGYMPPWLANVSSDCSSLPTTCPPTDHEAWARLIINYLDVITENGTYAQAIEVELWNEPDMASMWLADVQNRSDPKIVEQYNLLYNCTYSAIKKKYPSIQIGGPGISHDLYDRGQQVFLNEFLRAFPQESDFISIHKYRYVEQPDYDIHMAEAFADIYSKCRTHNATCDRIVVGEFNEKDAATKTEEPEKHAAQLATGFAQTLNTYPTSTIIVYQWSEYTTYSAGPGKYPEYPQRWAMVSEPDLDNARYAAYNITKNFATYHSGGSTIVESYSADPEIRIVGSYNQDNYYVTIINGHSEATSVTLNLFGINASAVINAETNASIPVIDGSVQVGILQPSQILHTKVLNGDPNQNENETALHTTNINATNETIYLSDDLSRNETYNHLGVNISVDAPIRPNSNETVNSLENETKDITDIIETSTHNSPQRQKSSIGNRGDSRPNKPVDSASNLSSEEINLTKASTFDRIVNESVIIIPASQTSKHREVPTHTSVTVEEHTESPADLANSKIPWIALLAIFCLLAGRHAWKRRRTEPPCVQEN